MLNTYEFRFKILDADIETIKNAILKINFETIEPMFIKGVSNNGYTSFRFLCNYKKGIDVIKSLLPSTAL